MKKRILSMIIAIVMVIGLVPGFAVTASAAAEDISVTIDTDESVTLKDTDGNGAYEIGTADELYAFAVATGKNENSAINGELTANIVVNEKVLNEDGSLIADTSNLRIWTGINSYEGAFDGKNHTISGLYYNGTRNYIGLFKEVSRGGTVKNVGVIDSYFRAVDNVGGISGHGGSVTNCSFAGNVSGSKYVGGIVGQGNGEGVTNCSFAGNVSGSDYVGGIVGYGESVTNCSFAGNVSGSNYVGGVVGYTGDAIACSNSGNVSGSKYVGGVIGCMGDAITCSNSGNVSGSRYVGGVVGCVISYGIINNCYNLGDVTGQRDVGGVLGGYELATNPSSRVENCYNAGSVNCEDKNYVGGILGSGGSNRVVNCYYLDSCGASGSGTAVTLLELWHGAVAYMLGEAFGQNLATNGDKIPVFATENNKLYKCISCDGKSEAYTNDKELEGKVFEHSYENGFCLGAGEYQAPKLVDGYYQIENAGQLYWFAEYVNTGNEYANAVLCADIVVNENVLNSDGAPVSNAVLFHNSWTPIKNFRGTFDGENHTISGLYYDNREIGKAGLFAEVLLGGTVRNVGVIDSYFRANDSVGGLVGSNSGDVINCYNSSVVSGDSYKIGGVVGCNLSNGNVTNCYNSSVVSGDSYKIGGVVGSNLGDVIHCYNTGTVLGMSDRVGGVVGYCLDTKISYCYNAGTVLGMSDSVGGVVGDCSNTKISDCYNIGTVSGNKYVGGIVGKYDKNVTFYHMYNTGAVSGDSYVGGILGDASSAQRFQYCYNTGVVSGSSFVGPLFSGSVDSSYTDCFYLGTDDSIPGCNAITEEDFISGMVAYLIGDVYGQNLAEGGDKTPVYKTNDNKVYRYTFCDGKTYMYTNDKALSDKVLDHSYENGFCVVGGECQSPELVDGYYEIGNAGQLFWFANYVNTVDRTANAKLTADIDLENRLWTPIGSTGEGSNNYRGHFDGQNHTINGLNVEGGRAGLGFFGEVRLGTVENFTIYGEVKLVGKYDYVGGVIGSAPGVNSDAPDHNGATIRNITSYVNVTLGEGSHGSNRVGGFMGYANHETLIENCTWYGTLDLGPYRAQDGVGGLVGKANDNSAVTIRNCAAYGTIKTTYQSGSYNEHDTIYIGGILSNSVSSASTVIENTVWAGTIVNETNLGAKAHISAFGTMNGFASITNCYVLDNTPYVTTNGAHDSYVTVVSEAQLASGKVAYLLGSAFGQEIGKDELPILGGMTVYGGYLSCADKEMSYSNDQSLSAAPLEHIFTNGYCVNGCYEPAIYNEDENHYEISNAGQLYWFARLVNIDAKKYANAILTADIDLEGKTWYPIGLYNDVAEENGSLIVRLYSGTFDGNGHTVSNFVAVGNGSQGLFGYCSSELAEIKNLGVINATVSGWNAGAVAGYGANMENCYAINCTLIGKSDKDSAGVTISPLGGNNGMENTIKNCFAYGCTLIVGEGEEAYVMHPLGGINITINNICNIENSYYVGNSTEFEFTNIEVATEKSSEQLASGEVAYLLGDAWGQTIGVDAYPIIGGAKVFVDTDGNYTNEKSVIGDVDGDGFVTNSDVLEIYKHIYDPATYPINAAYADVDGDGFVTNADVLEIYKHIYDPITYPLG